MTLKLRVKSILRRAGYEVRRLPRRYDLHVNAYYDQFQLSSKDKEWIVFDVGAHIGQTVGEYLRRFPKARIYAFEPFDESFQILSRAYKAIPSVKLFRVAITDQTGEKEFFTYASSATNSLLPVAGESGKHVKLALVEERSVETVETNTSDDFCAQQHLDRISVLKMDIQGGELMALRGAAGLLRRHAVGLIYTEILFGKLYEGQSDFQDIRNYLREYDYTLFGLYNLNHGESGILAWGDAIFISPRLEESLVSDARSS